MKSDALVIALCTAIDTMPRRDLQALADDAKHFVGTDEASQVAALDYLQRWRDKRKDEQALADMEQELKEAVELIGRLKIEYKVAASSPLGPDLTLATKRMRSEDLEEMVSGLADITKKLKRKTGKMRKEKSGTMTEKTA